MKKIKNLKDLLDYWGADTPQGLNRRVYKSTDCGASISVLSIDPTRGWPHGQWYHNGQDWSPVKEIQSFTIQTIVEGSEATVDSEPFVVPVAVKKVDEWVQHMEKEASRLWRLANLAQPLLSRDQCRLIASVLQSRSAVMDGTEKLDLDDILENIGDDGSNLFANLINADPEEDE